MNNGKIYLRENKNKIDVKFIKYPKVVHMFVWLVFFFFASFFFFLFEIA